VPLSGSPLASKVSGLLIRFDLCHKVPETRGGGALGRCAAGVGAGAPAVRRAGDRRFSRVVRVEGYMILGLKEKK
jgi:hypothetical protein